MPKLKVMFLIIKFIDISVILSEGMVV